MCAPGALISIQRGIFAGRDTLVFTFAFIYHADEERRLSGLIWRARRNVVARNDLATPLDSVRRTSQETLFFGSSNLRHRFIK